MQSDNTMEYGSAGTSNDVSANYMNFDLGANISGILVGANYELQSGKSGSDDAFITPLGTNHKFNGWADVFLANDSHDDGLADLNARVGYKAKGFGKVLAVYHKFDSDVKSIDLGSEIDVLYANKIPGVNGLNGLVKAAFFSQGDAGTHADTTKVWVQVDYKF